MSTSKTVINSTDGFRILYNTLTEAACISDKAYDDAVDRLDKEIPDKEVPRVAAIITPKVMDRARAVVRAMKDGEVITYDTLGKAVGTGARGATAIITSFGTEPEHAGIVLHKQDRSGMFVEQDDLFFSYYDANGDRLDRPEERLRSVVLEERGIPFSKSGNAVVIDPKDVRVLDAEEARSLLFV